MQYMSRQTRTLYTSVKFVEGTKLAEVTTPKTPQPYLVSKHNVIPYVQPKSIKQMKLPPARNRGASFRRGGEWVTIGTWDPFKLENFIKERRSHLHKIQNIDALQTEVDYIAALQFRLEHLHD